MMGYLFLAVVLASGTAKGYYGKKLSAYTQSLENAVRISVFRMALCAATGLLLVAAQGNLPLLRPDVPTLLLALCAAVRRGKGERLTAEGKKKAYLYAAMMALLLFANTYFKTRTAALLDSAVLYPLVQCLSMLLGMGMSAVAFGEKPTRRALIGMAIAIMGVLVINFC